MENDYCFPFPPYPQQQLLMDNIFQCIESSSIGCFESPTGTGKSLSAICSSFHWLMKEEKRILEENKEENVEKSNLGSDWLKAYLDPSFSKTIKESSNRKFLKNKFNDLEKKIRFSKKSNLKSHSYTTERNIEKIKDKLSESDNEYIIEDYLSDDGKEKKEIYKLLNDDSSDEEIDQESIRDQLNLPQIYYCSRTHSQLSQFQEEISKTIYNGKIKSIILSSRKNLCINPVFKSMNEQALNEKCTELLSGGTLKNDNTQLDPSSSTANKRVKLNTAKARCPYKDKATEENISYQMLNELCDLEDIVQLGLDNKGCPYYASKKAIPNSQVICLPYSSLLHQDIRDSLGLKLQNRVIIIDEAHNLLESINQLYSNEISLSQLTAAHKVIKTYLDSFQTRLASKNIIYLKIFLKIIKNLKNLIDIKEIDKNSGNDIKLNQDEIYTINDFIFKAEVDNIDFFKIKRYISVSKMIQRIGGYYDNAQSKKDQYENYQLSIHSHLKFTHSPNLVKNNVDEGFEGSAKSCLRALFNFIYSLTCKDIDGRIIIHRQNLIDDQNSSSIRFFLLNPTRYFENILTQAKSVILLGGTMQPFSYFQSTIFSSPLINSRVKYLSCHHIVPRNQVLALTIKGLNQRSCPLEFTHEKRSTPQNVSNLFQIILSLAKVVPGGIVIFFTSYQYLSNIITNWKASNLLHQLNLIKSCFIESRNSNTEDTWNKYCNHIQKSNSLSNGVKSGAILFSVVGGKLSEGINFSDDLARCVVVVGLPFPDTRDLILQEKVKYLKDQQEKLSNSSSISKHLSNSVTENVNLPEVMCMKAVNQAIGRSIRHIKDFSSIVLVDNRYVQNRISSQLPIWIQDSISQHHTLEENISALQTFYSVNY